MSADKLEKIEIEVLRMLADFRFAANQLNPCCDEYDEGANFAYNEAIDRLNALYTIIRNRYE